MLAQKTVPTLNQVSAFSRMRQRSERTKKENVVKAAAAARKRQPAPAMVAHTRAQATPGRENYSSTTASRVETTHDHTFGRVRPPEGRSSRLLMGMLLFHDVVRNHMHDYQMQ